MYQVICGFSGVGKSTAAAQYPDLLVDYQLTNDDPIVFIEDLIRRGKVVLLPPSGHVMWRLEQVGIEFVVVYPDITLKFDYLERYKSRGDGDSYSHFMSSTWNDQYFICHDKGMHHPEFILTHKDQTLVDALKHYGIV